MVRATAAGRYRAMLDMGFDQVLVPPARRRLQVVPPHPREQGLPIAELVDATNYGRKQHGLGRVLPAAPPLPARAAPVRAEVYDAAVEHYRRMEEAGFTDDDRLDAMFDSSGQLNPEYASTDFSMFKTRAELTEHVDGLYHEGLMAAVAKVRSSTLIGKVSKRWPRIELGELRSDLYQRQPDPAVVDRFAELYRTTGEDAFSPPIVSRREDGTDWLLDGQHRVLGAEQAGLTSSGATCAAASRSRRKCASAASRWARTSRARRSTRRLSGWSRSSPRASSTRRRLAATRPCGRTRATPCGATCTTAS
jgi:hypothetical protein